MSFIPNDREWLEAHYNTAPDKICQAICDIHDSKMLSVGCGDMLIEFGLLNRGAANITGLEIIPSDIDRIHETANRLKAAGFAVPSDYIERLSYKCYDGVNFPYPDDHFDAVYSWGAFEHVSDVVAVLSEMRRVLKPHRRGMISVFPWFTSYYGSHLSDYISEPFFHLKRNKDWIREKLEEYAIQHPDSRDLVTRHMWNEYESLNGYSAEDFYRDFCSVGFSRHNWQLLSYETELTEAPRSTSFSDLMITGSQVSFIK
ncbi:class I SAM-dependent methyltransferase [Methylobacterium nonmethylotrophicum]|nr:class I SAM-dependent methyltransferase [Methylobacterium nonmethylotrophicum]